jgi:hypothetical protein
MRRRHSGARSRRELQMRAGAGKVEHDTAVPVVIGEPVDLRQPSPSRYNATTASSCAI